MSKIEEILADLATKRDELALQVKLGSMEAKQEWEALEAKYQELVSKAKIEATAADVEGALEQLGKELENGYQKIKSALQ
jgi:hypothetical protein